MIGSLGSFLEIIDFGLQILEVTFFALTESSLGSSILRFAFLGGNALTLELDPHGVK